MNAKTIKTELSSLRRKVLSRRHIISVRESAIFAAGCAVLLLIFGTVSRVSSQAAATKQILGEAAANLGSQESMLQGFAWDSAAGASSPQFWQQLKKTRESLARAGNEVKKARSLVSFLPVSVKERETLAAADRGLDSAAELSDFVLRLLGGAPKTYLLIFQNNNEARATGGFIGTYGLLSLGNGVAKIDKIESIYALDGQLTERIAAPGPLQRIVTEHLGLRDSNWFADFPASSRKILEFLEKENGVLAEGIISFTPDVFEDLLEITGPVPMPEYGEVLTAQNFRDRAQYKTSIDYDRAENQPKKMLADFAPRLLGRLAALGEAGQTKLLEIMLRAIAQKHLLMFSLDPGLQDTILRYGAGGEMKAAPGDFLAVVHSNAGGGKTDQGIRQAVEKTVRIDNLGRQITTLKIERAHRATNELYLPRNVDFMRIYVPEGSRLISASGFDDALLPASSRAGAAADADLAAWDAAITRDWRTGVYTGRESGKTVFMGWLELDPGESRTVELSYALPQASKSYSLLLQKQAGALEYDFRLNVEGIGSPAFEYPRPFPITEAVNEDRFYFIAGR